MRGAFPPQGLLPGGGGLHLLGSYPVSEVVHSSSMSLLPLAGDWPHATRLEGGEDRQQWGRRSP